MKGIVIQFRRGRRHIHERHFLIEIPNCDTKAKAEKFIGSIVIWKSPGKTPKEIKGIVSAAHGNNGVIRARFEIGLPGQAIGTECEISEVKEKKKKEKE